MKKPKDPTGMTQHMEEIFEEHQDPKVREQKRLENRREEKKKKKKKNLGI